MDKKIDIDFMGEIWSDKFCSIYEVLLLHTGINRNLCDISKEAVERSMPSFYNKPLYAILNDKYDKSRSDDFTEHFRTEEEGSYYNSNKVIEDINIFGVIPESAPMEWVEKDEKLYLRTQAIVWKEYCGVINDILQNRDGNVKVSIEIALEDYVVEDNGIVTINKFKFLSVTMLGEKVMEGIAGSSIKSLKFSYEDLNEKYVSFSENVSDLDVVETIMSKYASEEDYGTGDKIKIDKTKESMSTSDWGSVDKTELRNKVLKAKNYKTLVNSIYALVESGWEEAPSEHLKYPIMEIKDGVAVYNRYALASALAYAKKENESAVISKIENLYKKLDINDDEGGEKKMEEKELNGCHGEEMEKIDNEAIIENENKDDVIDNEVTKKEENPKEEKSEEESNEKEDFESLKQSYSELLKKYNLVEEELSVYKSKEEKEEMCDMIDQFSHCMSEERIKELKDSVEESNKSDMEKMINKEIASFALSLKKEKEEKEEDNFSINRYFIHEEKGFSQLEKEGIDNIINNSSVSVCGK